MKLFYGDTGGRKDPATPCSRINLKTEMETPAEARAGRVAEEGSGMVY